MTDEQQSIIDSLKDKRADYVRCPSCHKHADDIDICIPWNSTDEKTMICPCGDVRLPYECQSGEFI